MRIRIIANCILVFGLAATAFAQVIPDTNWRLDDVPAYQKYQEAMSNRRGGRGSSIRDVTWSADGTFVNANVDGKAVSIDLATGQMGDVREGQLVNEQAAVQGRRGSFVGRAEQRTVEPSPDGKWNAVYRDNNIVLEPIIGEGEKISVTTTGTDRLRYGTGCWVYGEELDQQEAMWWSPDSSLLAFYEVNEEGLKDYFLSVDNTEVYATLHITRYPKAGEDNPQVSLLVYDISTRETRRLEIEGEPRQYIFNISFTPSGEELLVHRTNRKQDVLDVLAINPRTGESRVVVLETQATWQKNSPDMKFLKDGERFIWETEKNGWKNFELRHLDGRLLNPLSHAEGFPCEQIVKVDEDAGFLYYTAYSDEVPYNEQLHRVKLDGTEDRRISTSPLHHSGFSIDPGNRHVICQREQIDLAPQTVIYKADGTELAIASNEKSEAPEKATSELFSFMSEDGTTRLYGTLNFPSDFDPSKKYPLLVDVYGGPNSRGLSNRYQSINAVAELGFIVAKIGNRGTVGRGKAFESATYRNLGDLDLLDQATGVRFLTERPYIDGSRVGIYGHSYGGYMSAMALLKHPDVFHVGVAGAPVTDWKNYDTIYTERYMGTPQNNPEGYSNSSCMKYAGNLTGKLFIVHGLVDDNVHPSNTWQLIKALEEADKRFDMMIYPGFKHGIGSNYQKVRLEYLYEHLIGAPERPRAK